MSFIDFSSKDFGVDLGTANILVTLKGKGIVLREPAVVAVNSDNNDILATGKEAKEMLGKTPDNIKAIKPLKDGVIANLTATGLMIKNMIKKVNKQYNTGKPKVVVGVPSGITEVEQRAVEETFFQCGAKDVNLIYEPMAAAIGAGLNVLEPKGKMIVDIGGGTTDVAVISYGGVVASESIKVGGNVIDQEIVNYLKNTQELSIGLVTAEALKINIGCAEPLVTELTMEIRGRSTENGLPKNVEISSKQIVEAMKKPIDEIVEAVLNTLSNTPPEIVSDIMENGIYLAGGGALIRSLDNVIAQKTGVQTYIAETPLDCVAIGTGKAVEDLEKYQRVFIPKSLR